MITIRKEQIYRAFEAGIEAFARSLSRELAHERAAGAEQPSLLPSAATTAGQELRQVIAAYVVAFQERFGPKARPDLGGKVQGILRRVLRDYSEAQAIRLIQVYLKMEDEFFKKRVYDIATFEAQIQRVLYAATTGSEARDKTGLELFAEKMRRQEQENPRAVTAAVCSFGWEGCTGCACDLGAPCYCCAGHPGAL